VSDAAAAAAADASNRHPRVEVRRGTDFSRVSRVSRRWSMGRSAPRRAAAPSDVSANAQSNISYHQAVPNLRIRQAAELLGVSDDTVRRWINQGMLAVDLDAAGRKVVASEDLAEFSRSNAPAPPPDPLSIGSSARNRFVGLVTKVVSDTVMTQVEMQCGPFTVVSLMSTEAAEELKLRPGSVAVAVVKATSVIVETARSSTAMASD
jgi:molybdopterin-binding protein